MKSILVIGGGITGVTTAYALLLKGYEVTLMERHRYVAMETSYANGGQLSASNSQVWNHPGTVLQGAKWLFSQTAPLLINPKLSWHQARWFFEFMLAMKDYDKNTIATTRMAIQARRHLFAWAQEEDIEFNHVQEGILHIYRTQKEFKKALGVNAILTRAGLDREPVTSLEMKRLEPMLTGNFYGGFYTKSDSTGDIHLYTTGLAKAAVRRGLVLLCEHELQSISPIADGKKMIVTATHSGCRDVYQFDKVVVCAGVRSKQIAKNLDDDVNIYPVKGYSITVNLNDERSQQTAPTISLLDDATKIVTSRLGVDRFRVAGTAQFDGYNYNIAANRIKPLVDWVEQCFPNVSTRSVVPWAGLRPMMPNMMPVVKQGKHNNVFYNTGHGHLGWTLSAATADTIATLIENQDKNT